MPIQVTCSSCQGMFHAPDNAGGKRAKCPNCGGVILIPAAAAVEAPGAEAAADDAYDDDFSVAAPSAPAAGEERKQCPMCGEFIAASAIKCRFCGEIVDSSMRGIFKARVMPTNPAGGGFAWAWRRFTIARSSS